MRFGAEKRVEIFKDLATMSAAKVGEKYKFDKVYSNKRAVANAVYKFFTEVKNEPEKYGVDQQVVDMVVKAMQERRIYRGKRNSTILDKGDEDFQIQPAMMRIRDKAFNIIDRKLDIIGKSRKKVEKISFKELGVIAGIAFDKARLLQGEATEHISLHSKIDKDITPEDAMNLLLKMREVSMQEKQKTQK